MSDDVFGNAVGKVFLLRVTGKILKRQHGNRRLIGEGQRHSRLGGAIYIGPTEMDTIDMHRPGDVLDLSRTKVNEMAVELAFDLIENGS